MNEPLFISDANPGLPGLIEFELSEDINIPENKVSWINASLLVKSDACSELHGINQRNGHYWQNYYCIYGDGVLLYQGPLWLQPAGTGGWGWQYWFLRCGEPPNWRVKYTTEYPEQYPGSPSVQMYFINWYPNKIFSSRTCMMWRRNISLNINELATYETPGIGNHYPFYNYPNQYTKIKITKNIPDAEAFYHTDLFESYIAQSIVKLGKDKFRVTLLGELFTVPTMEEEKIEYEVSDIEYTWAVRYPPDSYDYVETKKEVSSLTKTTYSKKPSSVDLKLLITVQNPTAT